MKNRLLLIPAFAFLIGCAEGGYLRGSVVPSKDGKTYLSIVDDNGGGCGPILVDGKKWKYALHEPGPISPGIHTIDCGGEIEFEIPAGKVFSFDYWGP